MEDIIYWIWLSRLNIHPLIKKKLLDFYVNPMKIWKLSVKELKDIGMPNKYVFMITSTINRKNLNNYLQYIQKNNIKIIRICDSEYPKSLKNIEDAPIMLYAKGNIELLHSNSVAIIGCRNASEYGKCVAKKFACELSKNNITIISGLAKGIDTFAHIGCLSANSKTIAVLGNGIDFIYPNENSNLAQDIINRNGLIVSEYIMGVQPLKENFPERNRIISGLSNGILVVEAKERSGTFITVDYALSQGKQVYAIPGNIFSPYSEGTNELLKYGAKIVTKANDIIEDFLEIYN